MQEQFTPRFLNLLFAHLDSCKDVCDHFGITTTLVPYQKDGKVVGFTVKSFRNPQKKIGSSNVEDGEFEFEYDPFWDDGTDYEALYSGVDEQEEGGATSDPYPKIQNRIPDDDEEIIETTKQWVDAMMSECGICPFTQGAEKAGLPVGNVFYCVDRATGFEDMYVRYWKEVSRLEQNDEKEISTTLLICPNFCIDNLELFESFTNTLTQPLTALEIENLIQLVFFHPVWSFRDGGARSSTTGSAANYARRSPWPMINILRTSQVRAAQKGIPTGLVYKQNEKTLSKIGVDKLETMLRLRDWKDTAAYKVDRKEIDALKIARTYQNTGAVAKEDMDLVHDATPAANKVDRNAVEQGNLVNVLLQALDKRLGKTSTPKAQLTGPETSATAMASDVLVESLTKIAMASPVTQQTSMKKPKNGTFTQNNSEESHRNIVNEFSGIEEVTTEERTPSEIERARQERMEEARRLMFNEFSGMEEGKSALGRGDPMQDVLFGRGGIPMERQEDDEMFPEGMNPNSFY
jgi:hypothetical protein